MWKHRTLGQDQVPPCYNRWRGFCTRIVLVFGLVLPSFGQATWDAEEISEIFDGVHFDMSAAIARVEAKGITPYDFGRDLLVAGEGEKAKQWYQSLAIATKEPQYLYGLAYVKRQTGDNHGALKDAYFLMHKNPPQLIRARTLYLLGGINLDERRFEEARKNLQEGLEAYAQLNKFGGQYLCLSMMAWGAVFEGNYDAVEPLLDRALEFNEKIRSKGKEPYGLGRYHEIIGELQFAQKNYFASLLAAEQSKEAYQESGLQYHSEEMQAKIGLLKLMTGEPQEASRIATELWEKHHKSLDRGRLLAYNNVTLMKLSECAKIEVDRENKHEAAMDWANSAPGGKALIELLSFVKKSPCPEWR